MISLDQFTFSHSNKIKLETYLSEIMKREEVSREAILKDLPLAEIKADQNIQGKHKSEKIIQLLFKRRYPETSKLIEEGLYELPA